MRNNKKGSMRSSKPVSLGDALKEFVSVHKLGDRFDETKLLTYWETIVGTTIASRTTYLRLKNQQLLVKVDSAPLRNELLMSKQKVMELVNRFMGKEVVTSIVIQ